MKSAQTSSSGLTYESAGVHLDAKQEAFRQIKDLLRTTYRPEVLSELGTFGGLFALGKYREPVLVSSVDSLGTKAKIAIAAGVHTTVGYDIVAHCGNDIVVQGAEPLFFLDSIGIGRLRPEVVRDLMVGLTAGCRDIGAALIGGETAEMREVYGENDYDLVGCIVGVVERDRVVTGVGIRPGDALLGLPSVGLHTNGYTLARKVFFDVVGYGVSSLVPELGITVADELLKPHKSYVRPILSLLKSVPVHGLAHITGGGLPENFVRILPEGCRAEFEKGTWDILPVFGYLQEAGNIPEEEMYRVFNMGVGMVVVVPAEEVENALRSLRDDGEEPRIVGEILAGERGVAVV